MEVAEVLGKLVVELGQFLAAKRLQFDAEAHFAVGQFGLRVVLGVFDFGFANITGFAAAQRFAKRDEGIGMADLDVDFVLLDRSALHPGNGLDGNQGVIAVLRGAGIDVDELGFGLPDLFDARVHILIGHHGLDVFYRQAANLLELDLGVHLELDLAVDLLAFVKMQVLHRRLADGREVFPLAGILDELGDERFENFLADVGAIGGTDEGGGSLAGPEALQVGAPTDFRDNALGFAGDLRGGNRQFEFVLAAFN